MPGGSQFFYLIDAIGPDEYFRACESIRLDLLELYGKRYIFEHCLSEWQERQKQEAYRVYITDTLRAISESTAKYAGGPYIQARYADIIKPKQKDTRTGDEIAADVIKKAGLKLVKKGGE